MVLLSLELWHLSLLQPFCVGWYFSLLGSYSRKVQPRDHEVGLSSLRIARSYAIAASSHVSKSTKTYASAIDSDRCLLRQKVRTNFEILTMFHNLKPRTIFISTHGMLTFIIFIRIFCNWSRNYQLLTLSEQKNKKGYLYLWILKRISKDSIVLKIVLLSTCFRFYTNLFSQEKNILS